MKPDIDVLAGPRGVAMESPLEPGPDVGIDPVELEHWQAQVDSLKENPQLFDAVRGMFDEADPNLMSDMPAEMPDTEEDVL